MELWPACLPEKRGEGPCHEKLCEHTDKTDSAEGEQVRGATRQEGGTRAHPPTIPETENETRYESRNERGQGELKQLASYQRGTGLGERGTEGLRGQVSCGAAERELGEEAEDA